jgi:serine/threonine protein kinase
MGCRFSAAVDADAAAACGAPGLPRARVRPARVPSLADFEVRRVVGSGGFGRVFAATWRPAGGGPRQVAIKALSKRTIHERGHAEMVLRERALLARP